MAKKFKCDACKQDIEGEAENCFETKAWAKPNEGTYRVTVTIGRGLEDEEELDICSDCALKIGRHALSAAGLKEDDAIFSRLAEYYCMSLRP